MKVEKSAVDLSSTFLTHGLGNSTLVISMTQFTPTQLALSDRRIQSKIIYEADENYFNML